MTIRRRALVIVVSVLVLAGLAEMARADSDEACKARLRSRLGTAPTKRLRTLRATHRTSASGARARPNTSRSWKTASNGDATSGASVSPPPTPQCQEAMIAIDWVFADAGATGTFAKFRELGNSPIDSVIGAQGHNPDAQAMLRACAGWGANYLMATYGDAVDGLTRPVTDTGPQSCEALPSGLCYDGCQVSCPQGYAAFCTNGITWNTQCWRAPTCFCRRPP